MLKPSEQEWSRFHQIRETLSDLPAAGVHTRIEQLRREGENRTVLSMLEEHYRLASPPDLRAGDRLANRYTLKAKIGEGGMGIVYEAIQDLTQQEVALKVIHPALVSGPLSKRFLEEIRTLGRLKHDCIVRVFDADYDRDEARGEDLLFYAMQLVHGVPLIRWVAEAHPTIDARLECFIRICDAVDYAHGLGVVHRDLKPENILVDPAGRPAILDFGLAQIADASLDFPEAPVTPEGATILRMSGTPAFMSPERWDGRPGGVPSDVFALGALLHQMLTGALPWGLPPEASINDLRRAICDSSRPRVKDRRALGHAMTELVESMLAPAPHARPASAGNVARAVHRFLVRRRLKRRLRRTAPIWAGIVVAAGSAFAMEHHYAQREKAAREAEYRLSEASRVVRQPGRADTLIRTAEQLPRDGRLPVAKNRWRDVILESLSTWNVRLPQPVTLPAEFEPLACDPGGVRFIGRAAGAGLELIQRTDQGWNREPALGGRECRRLRVNPRRAQVVALLKEGAVAAWEPARGEIVLLLPSAEPDTVFEFSDDGQYLACSETLPNDSLGLPDRLSRVRVFNTSTWKEVVTLAKNGDEPEGGTHIHLHSRPAAGLAFSPDNHHLAVWSMESAYLLIWHWESEHLALFARHPDRIAAAAWRPEETPSAIATIQVNGKIRTWTLGQGTSAAYADPAQSVELGDGAGDFRGQLAWMPEGRGLAVVDERRRRLDFFIPDRKGGGFQVPLGDPGDGSRRWLSGGLLAARGGISTWAALDLDPPIRRIYPTPAKPSHLAFHPTAGILAWSDSGHIGFMSTASGAELALLEVPLSGPITFDATTGDFWAYHKTKGPLRWIGSAAFDDWTLAPGKSLGPSVGTLAALGGHLVYSQGSKVFVRAKGVSSTHDTNLPEVPEEGPPDQLAIDVDGRLVAAIWVNPARAALWRRQADDRWSQPQTLSRLPLIAGMPAWNPNPLRLEPFQERTHEEEALASRPLHFDHEVLLSPATAAPLVAWLRDADWGLHLDYLGRKACVHVATLPFDRGHGVHVTHALGPDGTMAATSNSNGEIHLWDLRRAFQTLADLQLGIDEFNLTTPAPPQSAPASVRIADPG